MNNIYLGDNNFSREKLNEYIDDILVVPGKAHITFETGEYGLLLMQRMISSLEGFIAPDFTNIKWVGEGDLNKSQFIKYKNVANNMEMTLVHNPELDKINSKEDIDPTTGYPIKSCTLYFKSIE